MAPKMPRAPAEGEGSGHRVRAPAGCRACALLSGCLPSSLSLSLTVPLAPLRPRADKPDKPALTWHESVVDADQSFRGLDAVDRRTAWVSGASLTDGGDAKVYLTTDAGRSWQDVSPPDTAGLNFRDVEAKDAKTASVLAIGEGEASRIYRTTDGGTTWTETFRNTEPKAFYNCLDFYPDGRHGLAVSDPVDGKFRISEHQERRPFLEGAGRCRHARSKGEANFSASGDCLVIAGEDAWFGSGGAKSRVFHSTDRGRTWTATRLHHPGRRGRRRLRAGLPHPRPRGGGRRRLRGARRRRRRDGTHQ